MDFKDIRFPVQVGDIRKIGKTNSIISISGFGYENKGISNIRVKKCYDDNDDNRDDLLSIEERGKKGIMF